MKHVLFKATMIAAALMSVAANAYGTDKDSISSKDYFIEGVMEYCAGEYGKAETLLGRCVGADPENDAAYYYLAVTRLAAGDTDKALLYLNTASELSPENQHIQHTDRGQSGKERLLFRTGGPAGKERKDGRSP